MRKPVESPAESSLHGLRLRVLRLAPLEAREWAIVLGLAAAPALAGQLWKLLQL